MTRTHQLQATLRTLKLGGMLDTLQQRLDQAHAGELGHLEFLQVLCEDEVNRRAAKALRERVRRAHFEEPATLEDFDFHFNPKLPTAQIRDLATCHFVELGEPPSSTARSVSARPTSPRRWAIWPAAAATRSPSPRPTGCSPSSPAATPTTPSRPACAAWPASSCSSSTTSACAASPTRPATTSSNWSANATSTARWC